MHLFYSVCSNGCDEALLGIPKVIANIKFMYVCILFFDLAFT